VQGQHWEYTANRVGDRNHGIRDGRLTCNGPSLLKQLQARYPPGCFNMLRAATNSTTVTVNGHARGQRQTARGTRRRAGQP